jgi:hypothetical protein
MIERVGVRCARLEETAEVTLGLLGTEGKRRTLALTVNVARAF